MLDLRDRGAGACVTRVVRTGGAAGRAQRSREHMSELDRYLDDLGARLDSARVRPRPRSRLVVTGAVALAIALTLSLAGGGGGETGEHPAVPGVGPVDAIAKASAALQVPAGQMLHMRVRSNITKPKQSLTEDLWATADPLRWRLS